MTTYNLLAVYTKNNKSNFAVLPNGYGDFFEERLVPKHFSALKDARAYAIKMMDNDRRIYEVQVSNPKYADVWQVATCVSRTDDGKYYWYAVRPRDTVGAGHYLNKDGTISKNVYRVMRW